MTTRQFRAIATLSSIALVAVLSGCGSESPDEGLSSSASLTAEAPTSVPSVVAPSPSATPSPSPAQPSAEPSVSRPAMDPDDPATWTITPTGMGPLTTDMTVDEVSGVTGVDYDFEVENSYLSFEGRCGAFFLDSEEPLNSIAVLVESEGISGPVDSYSVQPGEGGGEGFPTTQDGLGIGSDVAEVEAVYGAELQREDSVYVEGGERLWIESDGAGILFEADADGEVTLVTSGRLPQLRYIEGCA